MTPGEPAAFTGSGPESVTTYSIRGIRAALAKAGKDPRQALGQNYLVNLAVVEKIAHYIDDYLIANSSGKTSSEPSPAISLKPPRIVEIGPGLGSLTHALSARLGSRATLDLVETDGPSSIWLKEEYARQVLAGQVSIHKRDFLELELGKDPWRAAEVICGNLPYHITSPILFKCLEAQLTAETSPGAGSRLLVFMTQKEVAERILASSGSRECGILTVMCEYFCEHRELLTDVRPGSFFPPPKVNSAVFALHLRPGAKLALPGEKAYVLFNRLVRSAFNFRRKTLRNALETSGFFLRPSASTPSRTEDQGLEFATADLYKQHRDKMELRAEALGTMDSVTMTQTLLDMGVGGIKSEKLIVERPKN